MTGFDNLDTPYMQYEVSWSRKKREKFYVQT